MVIKLSLTQALDLAEAVLHERGVDYTYAYARADSEYGCVYFEVGGSYSCWVGGIFNKIGAPTDQFFNLEINSCGVSYLLRDRKGLDLPVVDDITLEFLMFLQERQDESLPYLDVLYSALYSTIEWVVEANHLGSISGADESLALLRSTLDRLNGDPRDDGPVYPQDEPEITDVPLPAAVTS